MCVAARPLLRQIAPATLGQKSIQFEPPEGLLLDEEGNNVPLVQLAPSDLAAAALALGLASAELLGHHTSFTLNNMVGSCSAWHLSRCCCCCCLPSGLVIFHIVCRFESNMHFDHRQQHAGNPKRPAHIV
jgi:hypothetical protein